MEVIHFPTARDYLPKHFCSFFLCLVTSFLLEDSVEEFCWAELDTTKTAYLTSVIISRSLSHIHS